MNRKTIFSDDRVYRYTLWREWTQERQFPNSGQYAMFIGLNPSTADETNDDPTIRRCVNFAKSWGYSALCMTNIFAFRSTDPELMKRHSQPVGPDNNAHLMNIGVDAGIIIAAWGTHGAHRDRGAEVITIFRLARIQRGFPVLMCLKKTKAGHPQHPLYIPATQRPRNL